MKEYKNREFQKILKNNGFSKIRCKGDHEIWVNKTGISITISTVRPNICVQQRLIKTYGLKL